METEFELKNFCSDYMLNHHLFQKLKLTKSNWFNRLINILTVCHRERERERERDTSQRNQMRYGLPESCAKAPVV
jgi:hypothetical protein